MTTDWPAWARLLENKPLGTRYRLHRLLGVGGMGAVYEAVQLSLDRRVAIKVLAPRSGTNADGAARFQREARLASSVAGRHVLDIVDFDVDPQMGPFIVMEYLYGESLHDMIGRVGRVAIDEACDLMTTLLDTLGAIHAQGIVHRDLKPSNLFLAVTSERERVLKVLDFGLSRLVDSVDPTRLTAAGRGVGTPWYAAPEQIGGQGDHRVDVYAAGVVLYECLAGSVPYVDDGYFVPGVTPPAPLDSRRPDLLPELVAIVHRAMERDPDRRFPDASSMAQAIRAVRAALPRTMERTTGPSATATASDLPAVSALGIAPVDNLRSGETLDVVSTPGAGDMARSDHAMAPSAARTATAQSPAVIAVPIAQPGRRRIAGVVAPDRARAVSSAPAPAPAPGIGSPPGPAQPWSAPPAPTISPPAARARSATTPWVVALAAVAILACVASTGVVVVLRLRSERVAMTTPPSVTSLATPPASSQVAVPGLPPLVFSRPSKVPTFPSSAPPPPTPTPADGPNTRLDHPDLFRRAMGGIGCTRGLHVLTNVTVESTYDSALTIYSRCRLTCIECRLSSQVQTVVITGSGVLRFERSTISSVADAAIRAEGSATLSLVGGTVTGLPAVQMGGNANFSSQGVRYVGRVRRDSTVPMVDLGGNTGL